MVNAKHVAILAKVSTATVSHVLNNSANVSPKLRERVLRVVRDLNYHPNTLARSLKTRKSKTVGMVITDITNAFYPAVVRGAEDVLAREDYTLVVGNTDGDAKKEEAYYRTFVAKRVDGLLLITCPTEYPPAYLSRHNPEETPVVLINRDYPSLGCGSDGEDDVGVTPDSEVKPAVPGQFELPDLGCFVVLLYADGRVRQLMSEEPDLLGRSFLDLGTLAKISCI